MGTAAFSLAGTAVDLEAEKESFAFQDSILRHNRESKLRASKEAVRRRKNEAQLLRRKAKKSRARNIAKGAPLAVLEESAMNAKIDELIILSEGQKESANLRQSADIDLKKRRLAKKNFGRKVKSLLLSSASDVFDSASKAFRGGGI